VKSRKSSSGEEYMLATGDAAVVRLRLLDEIFGPGTREFLRTVGLRRGWRVADIGCGIGLVALWIAEQVGGNGWVSAVDVSSEQLRVAKRNAAMWGLKNISFHEASAYETSLPRASFDLVCCRFLMCHLQHPLDAIREMGTLLKSGGVLTCEDCNDSSIVTDPPTRAYSRLVEISRALDAKRGLDSEIGLKLHRLFREAGFASPNISLRQVAILGGPAKKFWELTLREAAPAIIEAGAASPEELDAICAEMQDIARDETTLLVMPRVSQVWMIKE
jgi:ubiquinone/menaquinone biosynthesis C-methylase UbiE